MLVSDQVQMLMEMDEANKALDKAIDSGDAQLGTSCTYKCLHSSFLHSPSQSRVTGEIGMSVKVHICIYMYLYTVPV